MGSATSPRTPAERLAGVRDTLEVHGGCRGHQACNRRQLPECQAAEVHELNEIISLLTASPAAPTRSDLVAAVGQPAVDAMTQALGELRQPAAPEGETRATLRAMLAHRERELQRLEGARARFAEEATATTRPGEAGYLMGRAEEYDREILPVRAERDALRAALAPRPAPPAPALVDVFKQLAEAFWDMQLSPDCWCDTGDGNPHTPACLAAKAVTGDAQAAYNDLHDRPLSPLPSGPPAPVATMPAIGNDDVVLSRAKHESIHRYRPGYSSDYNGVDRDEVYAIYQLIWRRPDEGRR